MDYNKIKEAAQNYEADMTKFLRELVHFPGESCGEKDRYVRSCVPLQLYRISSAQDKALYVSPG